MGYLQSGCAGDRRVTASSLQQVTGVSAKAPHIHRMGSYPCRAWRCGCLVRRLSPPFSEALFSGYGFVPYESWIKERRLIWAFGNLHHLSFRQVIGPGRNRILPKKSPCSWRTASMGWKVEVVPRPQQQVASSVFQWGGNASLHPWNYTSQEGLSPATEKIRLDAVAL